MTEKKRRIKMRSWLALVIAIVLFAVTMAGGYYITKNLSKKFRLDENATAETVQDQILQKLKEHDYQGIYEATTEMISLKDSRNVYESTLLQILGGKTELYELQKTESNKSGYTRYRLYAGPEYLADVYQKDETGELAIPVYGNYSYIVEVPAGSTVTMNGVRLDNCISQNVEASDFFAVSGETFVPMVDVYQIDGLIGEPELEIDGKTYTCLKDVMSGHLLAGMEIDSSLHQMMIDAAEALARYPAQDGTLNEVTAVSYTASTWYQRYIGLQPYWFSPHEIMRISNQQVIKAVKQTEDTMVAHVVLDYFCDDGAGLSRTWNIGYQLTFVNVDDSWLICNTEIDCELNPNETPAE